WWWEIGAITITLVSIILMMTIFLLMNNQPLHKWTLPIQPSSLVAVLSTIARTALLYPVTECLGQLKWTYFDQATSRTLYRIQNFDQATRGPFGAVIFMCR
ncbi:hypothetical protein EJ04DRAFT_417970, partial [Polyplosphaeria fusca]